MQSGEGGQGRSVFSLLHFLFSLSLMSIHCFFCEGAAFESSCVPDVCMLAMCLCVPDVCVLAMCLCVFVCMVRLLFFFPITSKLTPRNCYFCRDTESKGEWGFKALKQMVKALFRQARYDDMMKRYHGAVCLFACMRVCACGLVLRVVLCERIVRACV